MYFSIHLSIDYLISKLKSVEQFHTILSLYIMFDRIVVIHGLQ